MPKPRNNWHTSQRPKRSREYWRNRAIVLRDAGRLCVIQLPGICSGGATEAHHVRLVWDGGSDDVENLRAACTECNAELNYRTRPRPKPKSLKRAPEKHPGLID